jgi:hypothetical protein
MSDFARDLIANYNKPKSQIIFENLKKIDKNFNTDNIFALAFMSLNENIPEEDREIFKKMLEIKLDNENKKNIHPLEKGDTKNN